MQVVLIGNAVLHETTIRALQEKWTVLKFATLQQFLQQLGEDADDYALWIHFDSEISEATFLGKKAPIFLLSTTTGTTHISPLVYNSYERSASMISLKGETEFLNEITSTAEHAWLLMLMLTSRMELVLRNFELKRYERSLDYKPKQISEMRIGIIGCGRLGSISYRYAKAFAMSVQVFDVDKKKYELYSIPSNDIAPNLEILIPSCEVILIHANSSVGASPILGPEIFELFKNGAYLVNTSRANLVDGISLISKLENGDLGGYAADVRFAEDLGGDAIFDYALEAMAKSGMNVLVTPHIGGSSASAILKCERFLMNRLIHAVDNPV